MKSGASNRHREWLAKCHRDGSPPFPLAGEWAISLTKFESGLVEVEMNVDERHHNPVGIVHGGVAFMLLDSCLGFAATSVLEGETSTSTIDVSTQFIKRVTKARLVGVGRVVRRGRTLIHVEAELRDDVGDLVARAIGTAIVLVEPA